MIKDMQREILFRGKLSHSKQWVEGNLITARNGAKYIIPFDIFERDGHHLVIDSDEPYWVDPETVGQFTGITDNNGTNIFEGDILKEQYGAYERIYDVFWKEDYFAFCAKYKNDSYYLDEIAPSHCKVMGNIYDNPELL